MSARTTIFLLLSLLLLLLACGEDSPTEPPLKGWSPVGIEGSAIISLELAWPYVYACTSGDGLFRSRLTRTAPIWKLVGFAEEWCYDAEILEDGTILAASSSGLYRSEDNGHSWTLSASGYTGTVFRVSSLTHCCDAVFAAAGYGLYRSEDSGQRWELVSKGGWGEVLELTCHPRSCESMWATIVSLREDLMLLASGDGGETWRPAAVCCEPLHYYGKVRGFAIDPMDENVAYVGTHGAVLKTTDGAATWTPIIDPVDKPWFKALALDPERRHHIYAGGYDWLYMSEDDGETVERVRTPLEEFITYLVCDGRHRALYVGTTEGVYKYGF